MSGHTQLAPAQAATTKTLLVMGQGYVGLPLAMTAVNSGYKVTGYDPSTHKTRQISKGDSPVEDVSNEHLQKALDGGQYLATHRADLIGNFDIAVICVPTPLQKGQPDLSYVESAAAFVGARLRQGTTVILESTTHPGTTRDVVVPILERLSRLDAGADFHVGFSPERIDPGNATWSFGNTPKLVSGLTYNCLAKVNAFYESMGVPTYAMGSMENAEMAKILENTFRHVNIALVNELTRVAHSLSIDMWDVIQGAATKPYGFMPFYPGPGVGGHCLPVDPVYLSHLARTELGQTLHMVELAQEVNEAQPAYVVQRLQDGLNEREMCLKGARVLVLGLAYKPDTADMRESPAVNVVELLNAKGARVDVLDEHVSPEQIETLGALPIVSEDLDSLWSYNAVVVLTPHSDIDLAKVAKGAAYVLDTRGVMPLDHNIERL